MELVTVIGVRFMLDTECPTPERWQEFLLGRIDDGSENGLADHLSRCDVCLRRLQDLQAEDELTEAMRRPVPELDRTQGNPAHLLAQRVAMMALLADRDAAAADSPTRDTVVQQATEDVFEYLRPPEASGELGRLAGYRVLRVLGVGGMGVVFEAEDPRLNRRIALKVLKPALAVSSSAAQRFSREAQAAAKVKHDGIVTIHDVGMDGNVPFLAMELLEGESLDQRLRRQSPLDNPEVLRIGREIADGLAAAHARDLIHRDIKPGNIWLEKPAGRVKLVDFGLARALRQETQITREGAIVGTPAFMAPEQSQGGEVDGRADLFSLGCILYLMATGSLPFQEKDTIALLLAIGSKTPATPRQQNPRVPAALSALIMKLLAKKPEDRPESAREVADALQRIEEDPAGANAPPRSRWPWWLALVVAIALIPAALVYGGQIIRFVTNRGELIVEVDDPRVVVTIAQKQLIVHEKTTDRRFVIEAGDGEVRVFEKDGIGPLVTKKFTLNRGGKTTVTVTMREVVPDKKTATPPKETPAPKKSTPPAINPQLADVPDLGPVALGESPFDALRREDIPPDELEVFGGASRVKAPKELAAILGDSRLVHWDQINALAFSPAGGLLASAGPDGLRIWDIATGRQKHWFSNSDSNVSKSPSFAFSPDGKRLAFAKALNGSTHNSIQVVDLRTGQILRYVVLLTESRPEITDLSFSADGATILAATRAQVVRYDVVSGKVRKLLAEEAVGKGATFGFSGDGKKIASAHALVTKKFQLKLWNAETGKLEVVSKEIAGSIEGARPAFTPDGKHVYHFMHGQVAWELASNSLVQHATGKTLAHAFRPDGKMLAFNLWQQEDIAVVEPRTRKRIATLAKMAGNAAHLAWSADGKTLAISRRNSVVLFDADTWTLKPLENRDRIPVSGTQSLAVLADGAIASAPRNGGQVILWELPRATARLIYDDPTANVLELAIAPDGKTLAFPTWPDKLHLWDMKARKEIGKVTMNFAHPVPTKYPLSFSADGKTLVSAMISRLRILDAANPFVEPRQLPFQGRPSFLFLHPNGTIISGGKNGEVGTVNPKDGTLKPIPGLERPHAACLDIVTGRMAFALTGKSRKVAVVDVNFKTVAEIDRSAAGLCFTPNGYGLVLGSYDELTLVDPTRGKIGSVIRLRKKDEKAGGKSHDLPMAFAQDGRHLVMSNPNGTLYVFRLAPPVEGKTRERK